MMHPVLCFTIWTFVSVFLLWRLIAIAKRAVNHLKRLHQIPCANCTYFTGDYRLKCTVNPLIAMSETAIGCRDFMTKSDEQYKNNQKLFPSGCFEINKCSKSKNSTKHLALNFSSSHPGNDHTTIDGSSGC